MTLDALTSASVHSLWSSPKCLNQLCLTAFSSLRSSLLLVHLFLPNFFLPVNFAFNMLWYSTLWTATPFSNDLLWLTLLWRVSMIVFWTIAKSAVFPIIYWNSNVNILIFWDTDFWLSLAVSSNHQNFLKKLLKCFTLHVMNLKYMKFSLFEISYKKKITSFLRCTCII